MQLPLVVAKLHHIIIGIVRCFMTNRKVENMYLYMLYFDRNWQFFKLRSKWIWERKRNRKEICRENKQGNYSLGRPPKLIIPKILTKQRWATVYRFMCNCICKSKQAYMTSAKVMSSLRYKINQKLLTFKKIPSPWPARCPQIWHLYVWPIYQHSHHQKSNCQKASTAHPQICHLYVGMTHIPTLTPS